MDLSGVNTETEYDIRDNQDNATNPFFESY